MRTEPTLPVAHYRLEFGPQPRQPLPAYPGSMWRGAFGHALRALACLTRQPTCDGCLLKGQCAYAYLFETPLPDDAEKMRLYTAAPHPFVLRPVLGANGSPVMLDVILMGRGTEYVHLIVEALARAAADGVGSARVPLRLEQILQKPDPSQDEWTLVGRMREFRPLPTRPLHAGESPGSVRIEIEHPLRLRIDNREVRPDAFTFGHFFSNLLRRISMLQYFHTSTPLETDFASLTATAHTVAIRNPALRWHAWNRYSSRQQKKIAMDGLVGSFDVDLRGAAELWPYVWLGQWVHAGKGAVMGLGYYRASPTSTI